MISLFEWSAYDFRVFKMNNQKMLNVLADWICHKNKAPTISNFDYEAKIKHTLK